VRRYASFWSGIPIQQLDVHDTFVFITFPTIFLLCDLVLIVGMITTVLS
jgi:hypothetical protein